MARGLSSMLAVGSVGAAVMGASDKSSTQAAPTLRSSTQAAPIRPARDGSTCRRHLPLISSSSTATTPTTLPSSSSLSALDLDGTATLIQILRLTAAPREGARRAEEERDTIGGGGPETGGTTRHGASSACGGEGVGSAGHRGGTTDAGMP